MWHCKMSALFLWNITLVHVKCTRRHNIKIAYITMSSSPSLQKMTKEQLSCEKTVLQKNLLHYEGLHGRPVRPHTSWMLWWRWIKLLIKVVLTVWALPQVTREERMVVKPLYDRYRLVKQMLTRVSITPITVRTQKHNICTHEHNTYLWPEHT